MYIRIGGFLRPFNEASVEVTYDPQYAGDRTVLSVIERWNITGRIINDGGDWTESEMTQKINLLKRDTDQSRPKLTLIEDDGSTPSALELRPNECLDGPHLVAASFPNAEGNVYATGYSYSLTYEADRRVDKGSTVMSFREQIAKLSGGREIVFVGGAINLPQKQIGREHAPYAYTQSGEATGKYGYPAVPSPIWPASLSEEPQIVRDSPKVLGTVDTEFRITWQYNYEEAFSLNGVPHRFTQS